MYVLITDNTNVILKGAESDFGNTIETNRTLLTFESEQEMNDYISDNNLIEEAI